LIRIVNVVEIYGAIYVGQIDNDGVVFLLRIGVVRSKMLLQFLSVPLRPINARN
jgi:hypothetical protein